MTAYGSSGGCILNGKGTLTNRDLHHHIAITKTPVHFGFAVRTEYKPGEHVGLSRFRSAVTLLSDFLNLVEHLWVDNRRMRVVEDSAVFCWILSLLLIPNGIRVGFEVDRAAGV